MNWIPPEMMPQVLTGVFVAICSLFITRIVNNASKKFGDLATKEYVTGLVMRQLDIQSKELGQMFVNVTSQAKVNTELEARLHYLEDQIWQRFEKTLEIVITKYTVAPRVSGD